MLFCSLFLLFDRSFILLRNYCPSLEADKRLEKVINKQLKSDIFVFGASRGARDIIASQISDSLKCSAYNLSYPGGDIEFQWFIFKQLLKYNKPKLIIMTMDDNTELSASVNVHYRYDRLYPLVKYDVVRNELIRKDQKNKYLSELFILHQLNKSNFDIRKRKFTAFDSIISCGSMPVNFQTKEFKKIFSDSLRIYQQNKELTYKVKYFNEIIDLCNKSNIKLMFVFPPNFFKPCVGFYSRINNIAQNKAYTMKYDTIKFKSPDLFNDENHLQIKGAVIFTNEIIEYIKEKSILKNYK